MSIFHTRSLLATDGSAEGQLAARTAADLAQKTDYELHVAIVGAGLPISATTSPARFEDVLREHRRQAEEVLEQQTKSIEESGGAVDETHLREGRAEEEIVEVAEEIGAGLIVMGSKGYRRLRRALLGSVSDAVVRHAHCPVTIVREVR
jgi:nucleotide-binding universal stress UspA family protein